LLLLIAGIDDDGSISRSFRENDRVCDTFTCIYVARSSDEFISNSQFFSSLVRPRKEKEKGEEREREKKKSFTQSLLPEEAEFFADWLVRVYMVPEGMIGRKQRTDAYRKEKYT
jgi:hypothetical protein